MVADTAIKEPFPLDRCLYEEVSFPLFFCIILLAVLFGLDIATTNMILLLGGYEKNMFMVLITSYPLFHLAIKGLVLFLIIFVVQFSECKIKGSGQFGIFVIIALYSFVIYNNVSVLVRLAGM